MVVRPEKPGTSFLTAQDLFLTVKTPAFVKVGVAGVARPPGGRGLDFEVKFELKNRISSTI